MIGCLKKSGLEIKDIKKFMNWCVAGPSTYADRRDLFLRQKESLETEIAHMNKALDMLKFKCWYYEQAMKDGNEDKLKDLIPNHLPDGIREAYERAHEE